MEWAIPIHDCVRFKSRDARLLTTSLNLHIRNIGPKVKCWRLVVGDFITENDSAANPILPVAAFVTPVLDGNCNNFACTGGLHSVYIGTRENRRELGPIAGI